MPERLARLINAAWADRDALTGTKTGQDKIRSSVDEALSLLDSGAVSVAEPDGRGGWNVNEWLKKAILLSFRLYPDCLIRGMSGQGGVWWDRIPSRFANWDEQQFKAAGFRVVPPAMVRRGTHIARGAVLMPCFVNIGARIGEGTMIDTWATVGSCAWIGKHVHLSGGAGIGGVLEPLQSRPVIVEDGCFIGARAEIAEGVVIREGSVIAMGVFLSQSTKIIDRQTGKIRYGEVPPYSVVVPGSAPCRDGEPALAAAIIIKTVDARTRSKTGINQILRD